MTHDTILANAKIILENEVVRGNVVMRDGYIEAVDIGTHPHKGVLDCAGDYLAPGLLELHTDNLERHISPRPRVEWPHGAAILAHDRELAGAGITTVFDAMRVGSIPQSKSRFKKYARALASELLDIRAAGLLKISHFLHLRAEICSETLVEELAEFTPDDRVGILSLMDHTPGQRQFSDLATWKAYVMGKHAIDEAAFKEHEARLREISARLGSLHEDTAVIEGRRLGAVLASHDDTTAEQVKTSATHGVTMAEFPTTLDAAETCRDTGLAIIMGSPNLVRGGSHSGNVAAHDLAQRDLLDIMSSDYVPAALLMSAVQLGELWGNMARGLATVTAAPARHVGLADRGIIAPGKRADIIRFNQTAGCTVVRQVWSHGQQVA